MHFCHEELYMIMAAVPGLGLVAMYVKNWIHKHMECSGHNHKENE